MAKHTPEEDQAIKDYCTARGVPDFRTDEFAVSYGAFLENVVLPRGIAERRRKAGDPTAKARDFCPSCGIDEDLRSTCCARRDGCPHAAGADIDANLENRCANWERRQALFREIREDYMASLNATDVDPFKEFARYLARRKQRRAGPVKAVFASP